MRRTRSNSHLFPNRFLRAILRQRVERSICLNAIRSAAPSARPNFEATIILSDRECARSKCLSSGMRHRSIDWCIYTYWGCFKSVLIGEWTFCRILSHEDSYRVLEHSSRCKRGIIVLIMLSNECFSSVAPGDSSVLTFALRANHRMQHARANDGRYTIPSSLGLAAFGLPRLGKAQGLGRHRAPPRANVPCRYAIRGPSFRHRQTRPWDVNLQNLSRVQMYDCDRRE